MADLDRVAVGQSFLDSLVGTRMLDSGIEDPEVGGFINLRSGGQLLKLPEQQRQQGKSKAGYFAFAPAAELLANHAPPIWLIEDMIEAGTLGQVFGVSACGKSFLVMDWAACIATGRPWQGKAAAPGAVFYIAGEGFSGFRRRLRAWEIHNGTSLADAPLFFSRQPAALMDSTNAAAIIQAVKELEKTHGKPALIVVDTLHRNMGDGDENSAADVALFLQSLDAMRFEFGAAVLVVHHSGHSESARGRGSSSLRAAVDHEYLLTKHRDSRRELVCTKAKEAEPPPALWFELKNIELDWIDGKGGMQSSAVLVPCNQQELGNGRDKLSNLSGALRIAYLTLLDSLEQDGEEPCQNILDEFKGAANHRVVHEDAWRKRCYTAGIADGGQGAKQKAFARMRKQLIDRKLVGNSDLYYWLSGAEIEAE